MVTGKDGLLETMASGSVIAISSTCAPEMAENPPDWTGTGTDLS